MDERLDTFVADLAGDPLSGRSAFEGVTDVYMLNQPTLQESAEGLFAVELAREAGVRRFVYQSVFKLEDLAFLPHVAPKLTIQRAVMRSGMRWTILSPNHFYQNDTLSRTSLLERGEYAVPVGPVGCSSVDTHDIAHAAFIVLTSGDHDGKNYPVVGPQALTSEDCAEAWSSALGRRIGYQENVEVWRENLPAVMPGWLTFDLSLMYRYFEKNGFKATEEDVAAITGLLGRPLTRYQEYVSRQAAEWQ
jgi:uncharacterized protein YbjT (DUF2867 family)